MALRIILQQPDERLRKASRDIKQITPRILELLDDMKETLAQAKGYGLAAPQVGVLRKAVVIDMCDGEGPIELINPEILEVEGEQVGEEGCLSCGDIRGIVSRPEHVIFQAQNRRGETVKYDVHGLFARCICHECDHLKGGLFLDIMEQQLGPNEYYDEETDSIVTYREKEHE